MKLFSAHLELCGLVLEVRLGAVRLRQPDVDLGELRLQVLALALGLLLGLRGLLQVVGQLRVAAFQVALALLKAGFGLRE